MQTGVVLQFSEVSLPPGRAHDTGLSGINLRLSAGELVLVQTPRDYSLGGLPAAAQGLTAPAAGHVELLGRDWSRIGPDEAARLRGRTGRVFQGRSWVNNLDVDENIALRLLHHSKRSPASIMEEAASLARAFGFTELPRARPAWVGRDSLQRAQWVRALLGPPDLLLFEFPEDDVEARHIPALHAAVRRILLKGSAALWITPIPRPFAGGELTPDRVYSVAEGKWHSLEKGDRWQSRSSTGT